MEIRYLDDDPGVVSTIAGWIFSEWGHLVPGRSLQTAHQKVRQAAGRTEVPLTLVGFENGQPVGTASIDSEDMDTHPELTPWMASVYVAPAMRGRGIGTALCRRVKEELLRLGIGRAYLFTPDQEKLYQRLGWKTILTESYRGESVVIMQLDLE